MKNIKENIPKEELENINNALVKFGRYISRATKNPTDEHISMYDTWLDCMYDIQKIIFTEKDMFYKNTLLFIKKEKWFDFIKVAGDYGFKKDADGDYIYKTILSEENSLYFLITIDNDTRIIFTEFYIPCSYWLEVGLNTFEPLVTLYKLGFIEMKEE